MGADGKLILSKKRFNAFLCMFMLLLGINFSVYQSLITDINSFFGLDGAAAGALIALYFLGSLLAPTLAGELSDRAGKKVVLIVSCAVLILGLITISQAYNIVIAGLGILLAGTGSCTFEGLLSAKITDDNPQTSEKIMNFSQLFFCVGAVLGPMLSLAVKSLGGGWQLIMLLNAIVFIPALAPLAWIQNDKKTASDKSNTAYSLTLIKDTRFLVFFFSMMLYVGAEGGVGFFITSYYSEAGMVAYGEIALSLFWAGMIVGRLLAGIFYKQSNKIMMLCIAFSAFFSFLLQIAQHTAASIALFFLLGLGMSAIWPLLMAFCTKTFSHYSGTAGGLMVVGASLGGMLGPALIGAISSAVGVRRAFVVSTVSMIIIFIVNLPTKKIYINFTRN